MKRLTLLSVSIVLLTNLIYSQSVDVKDGSTNTLIQINDEGTTGSITIPSGGAPGIPTSKLYNESGTLKWNGTTLATGSSLWTLNGSDIYRSSGNVGIGISSPNSKLHLYDNTNGILGIKIHNASSGSSAQSRLVFDNNQTAGIMVFNASYSNTDYANLMCIYNNRSTPDGKIDFVVNGSAKMIINNDGNIGIGTTNPLSKLSVGGDGEANTAVFGDAVFIGGAFKSNGVNGYGVIGFASNTGTGHNYGGSFEALGGSGIGVVGYAPNGSGKGVVGVGKAYDFDATGPGVDYGSTSSIRWKSNVVEIDSPIDKINELRGVYFDWDEEHGGHRDIGCIAEEVGKVLPEIVVYEENGIDADGMDYSKLTPLLVEAVKELSREVDRLKQLIRE